MPAYPPTESRGLANRPPPAVQGAFWIFVAFAAISVINMVLVLTDGTFDRAVDDAGSTVGGRSIDVASLVSAVKVTTVVVTIVSVALFLFFAVKMRSGRNWARIVLTVLVALSLISQFSVSAVVSVNGREYSSASNVIWSWLGVAAVVIAIGFMYQRSSRYYFTSRPT